MHVSSSEDIVSMFTHRFVRTHKYHHHRKHVFIEQQFCERSARRGAQPLEPLEAVVAAPGSSQGVARRLEPLNFARLTRFEVRPRAPCLCLAELHNYLKI